MILFAIAINLRDENEFTPPDTHRRNCAAVYEELRPLTAPERGACPGGVGLHCDCRLLIE
ncbi:hypothetical protein GCM10010136_10050 [Limoniibacter endophyticus]|uniref:Uncharacterized protein n=1 Tax=Limoniibacter endophyticus TaxID=1565040 RepID=A0A8J3GHJ7_9HYPH|nr:hypothetical protein GCM10010136_10050 [Limoniibacter endophyticus]